jgi:hypothetical protein
VLMMQLLLKNKGGCYSKNYNYYGKWWWFYEVNKSSSEFWSYFPHSKIVEIINVATDDNAEKNFC